MKNETKKIYAVQHNYLFADADLKRFDNLKDAIQFADDNVAFTQQDIKIYTRDKTIMMRKWYGYEFSEDEYFADYEYGKPISYGKFGFYTGWILDDNIQPEDKKIIRDLF